MDYELDTFNLNYMIDGALNPEFQLNETEDSKEPIDYHPDEAQSGKSRKDKRKDIKYRICKECGFVSSRSDNLLTHRRRVHQENLVIKQRKKRTEQTTEAFDAPCLKPKTKLKHLKSKRHRRHHRVEKASQEIELISMPEMKLHIEIKSPLVQKDPFMIGAVDDDDLNTLMFPVANEPFDYTNKPFPQSAKKIKIVEPQSFASKKKTLPDTPPMNTILEPEKKFEDLKSPSIIESNNLVDTIFGVYSRYSL